MSDLVIRYVVCILFKQNLKALMTISNTIREASFWVENNSITEKQWKER